MLLLDGYPGMEWWWPFDRVPYVGMVFGGLVRVVAARDVLLHG